MAKLTQLRSPLPVLAPRIGWLRDDGSAKPYGQSRDRSQPWRAWYKTARWQRLRWQVLVRDGFTCRFCNVIEAQTARLVADHIIAHRGDEALFWNADNLQCLCKACHDSTKQSAEKRGGWSNLPTP